MAKLFDLSDRRYWVYQPNFVRWRHRFRGVRESLKVNQEIGQYYFDISNARYKMDNILDRQENNVDSILDGDTFSDLAFYNADSATPAEQEISISGFNELISQMDRIRHRVRRLERND